MKLITHPLSVPKLRDTDLYFYPTVFMAWCFNVIKHRDNFTATISHTLPL